MIVKSLAAVLLTVSLANCSPIGRRDAATVLSDLQTIGSSLSTLESAVSSWSGSLLTALPIIGDYDNLKTDLHTAISDTTATSSLDTSDSSSITSEVETLATTIINTIDVIIAKESEAASAGIKSDLLSNLQTLQTLTDTLASDLEAIVTSTDAATITSTLTSIDAAFSSGIAIYS